MPSIIYAKIERSDVSRKDSKVYYSNEPSPLFLPLTSPRDAALQIIERYINGKWSVLSIYEIQSDSNSKKQIIIWFTKDN